MNDSKNEPSKPKRRVILRLKKAIVSFVVENYSEPPKCFFGNKKRLLMQTSSLQ